jgi:radical SAM protein with 4Fe4S-binding SPASM domain
MCPQDHHNKSIFLDTKIVNEKLGPLYPQLRRVFLSGGEVTALRGVRQFTRELLSANPRIELYTSTNGLKWHGFLPSVFRDHGAHVNFSVNAATKGVYETLVRPSGIWQTVIGNVRDFVHQRNTEGSRCLASISMVILNENHHQVAAFLQLAESLGVDWVRFWVDPVLTRAIRDRPLAESAYHEAHTFSESCRDRLRVQGLATYGKMLGFQPLFDESDYVPHLGPASETACLKPYYSLAVEPDGSVQFCCSIAKSIGDLSTGSIEEIWNSETAKKIRRSMRRGRYPFCSPTCPYCPNPPHYGEYLFHRCRQDFARSPKEVARKISNKGRAGCRSFFARTLGH